jgi:hypothetical protein
MSPKPEDLTLLLNVFREGLIRGLISTQEIVSWADYVILATDEPDYLFIELSLNSNKNELIGIIDQRITKADNPICPRVLLGVLYRKLISDESALTVETAAKLLETFLDFKSLSSFEISSIYTFDDYEIYYWPDLTQLQVELMDFLSEYDLFTIDNYTKWAEINVQVETVLERKEAEAVIISASFRNTWEKNTRMQRIKRKLKIAVAAIVFLALTIIIVDSAFNPFQIQWPSLCSALTAVFIVLIKKYWVKVDKKSG